MSTLTEESERLEFGNRGLSNGLWIVFLRRNQDVINDLGRLFCIYNHKSLERQRDAPYW